MISQKYGVDYNISFSEQKPSTDTVAANPDNTPFRKADGSLLFRPGGHGALIENLNDIEADVVFVKNIDNVVPDRLEGRHGALQEPPCRHTRQLAAPSFRIPQQTRCRKLHGRRTQ